METKEFEFKGFAMNGFVALFVEIAIVALSVWSLVLYSEPLGSALFLVLGITDGIKDYFTDIMLEGREITVRFSVEKGSNVLLGSECATGDSYSDWIMDYMDLNTKKGTYKLQNNTDYELYFTNVRIPVLREDGTQFSAYHWARQCTSAIRNDCGIKASNKVQGLGEVNIVIKGF